MEDLELGLNVADGRCPTIDDLYTKIKHLEGENFQLRVRIYMNEQLHSGGNANKFDPHSKNALAKEYELMKKQKDEAELKCESLQTENDELELKLSKLKDLNTGGNIQEKTRLNYEEKIANMTKALVDLGTKCAQLESENKTLKQRTEELQNRFDEVSLEREKDLAEHLKALDLSDKLRLAHEQVERLVKENDITIVQRNAEKQAKERQIQAQSQQMSNLLMDNQVLLERLHISEEALKLLHHEHSKLVSELKHLKGNFTAHVLTARQNDVVDPEVQDKAATTRQDTSPDLGIESGQEASANNENLYAENAMLRNCNRQLILKLQQTRQTLDRTVNRLTTTTKHKEQVEKAVCRQLHKTHSILKEAKQSLENKQSQQVLTDLVPPSV